MSFNNLSYKGVKSVLNIKYTSYDDKLTTVILSGCLQYDDESSLLSFIPGPLIT